MGRVKKNVGTTTAPPHAPATATGTATTTSSPKNLAVENLTGGYGSRVVIEGVNLTVEPGTILCLLGPNGVGKTTLLASLVSGEPSRLTASGVLTTDRVGYVPQRLDPLSDEETVLTALTLLAMLPGFLGLIVLGPILGHASWHAYRDAVIDETRDPDGNARG